MVARTLRNLAIPRAESRKINPVAVGPLELHHRGSLRITAHTILADPAFWDYTSRSDHIRRSGNFVRDCRATRLLLASATRGDSRSRCRIA